MKTFSTFPSPTSPFFLSCVSPFSSSCFSPLCSAMCRLFCTTVGRFSLFRALFISLHWSCFFLSPLLPYFLLSFTLSSFGSFPWSRLAFLRCLQPYQGRAVPLRFLSISSFSHLSFFLLLLFHNERHYR